MERLSQNPCCNGYVVFKREEAFKKLLDLKYIKYYNEMLKVEQYVKQIQRDDASVSQDAQPVEVSVQIGPLCSLRPTQSLYHKQGGHKACYPESNFRFNVLFTQEYPMSELIDRVSSGALLSRTCHRVRPTILKLD